MNQCIKYLSALNIINLANNVVANNLVPTADSNSDTSFDQLFKWRTISDGFEEARNVKKPIFLLIHKPQCPSCVKLKAKFSKSVRLMDISDRFVMTKAETNSSSIVEDRKFQPDGKYVPRILFFTCNGEFIRDAYNMHPNADNECKYFYKNPSQIVDTMFYVLKKYTDEPLPITFQHGQPSSQERCDMDDEIFCHMSK